MRFSSFVVLRLAPTVAATVLVLATASAAHADEPLAATPAEATGTVLAYAEPASPEPAASSTRASWYGWQTLTADGASTVLLGAGVAAGGSPASGVLALSGVTGFTLGAPIVHAAHGRWAIAGADLGLRVGAVVLGGLVGAEAGSAAASSSCKEALLGCLGDSLDGMVIGVGVGAVAASALDAALLSREAPAPKDAPPPAMTWSPNVSMLKGGGASGGLTGTF